MLPWDVVHDTEGSWTSDWVTVDEANALGAICEFTVRGTGRVKVIILMEGNGRNTPVISPFPFVRNTTDITPYHFCPVYPGLEDTAVPSS